MTGFGLIGCGAIADVHLKAMADTDGARIVEVASRDRSKAQQTGERFSCSWTTDYTQLLQRPDIDVVCVCTSSGSHGSIGRDVLKAGKHLIVEKPIAMTAAEASAMIEMARQSGLVLSVISQSRFNEHHRLVKQVLEEEDSESCCCSKSPVRITATSPTTIPRTGGGRWRRTAGRL
ncbi:Gfo/Idh/MocA family oxidoreductase [Paenibacillus sp. CC-CFT747]|nr:Gfo/Idh/MocA family oxidoreductase [Paenibacillus sp. CC-CFT747]